MVVNHKFMLIPTNDGFQRDPKIEYVNLLYINLKLCVIYCIFIGDIVTKVLGSKPQFYHCITI